MLYNNDDDHWCLFVVNVHKQTIVNLNPLKDQFSEAGRTLLKPFASFVDGYNSLSNFNLGKKSN